MSFDYSKLAGRITEKFKTQQSFANEMGLSERSVSLKLNGKREWKQTEIERARHLLNIDEQDISSYFFKLKVQ